MSIFVQFSDNARRRRDKRNERVRGEEAAKVIAEERERASQLLAEAGVELDDGNYPRASTVAREGLAVEMGTILFEVNEFLNRKGR